MNKIKLVLFSVMFFVSSLVAKSQYEIGFFVGPQASTAHYMASEVKQETKQNYGFQAGVGMILPIEPGISFVPSVFYSMKGYKVTFNRFLFPPDSLAADNDTRIHCVELAALLQFDFGKNPAHWFCRFGPSLDFQLFGHEKYNLIAGGTVSRKMKFGFADYGHYSANVLLNLGYETASGLLIYAQYTYGLTSISNADGGPKILHRAYGITIGKYLHRGNTVIDTRNRE